MVDEEFVAGVSFVVKLCIRLSVRLTASLSRFNMNSCTEFCNVVGTPVEVSISFGDIVNVDDSVDAGQAIETDVFIAVTADEAVAGASVALETFILEVWVSAAKVVIVDKIFVSASVLLVPAVFNAVVTLFIPGEVVAAIVELILLIGVVVLFVQVQDKQDPAQAVATIPQN